MKEVTYCWSRVFTEPDFDYAKEYPDMAQRRVAALADGLSGWGNCYGGAKAPKVFGGGMVKIDRVLKIIATPENLSKMSEASKYQLIEKG